MRPRIIVGFSLILSSLLAGFSAQTEKPKLPETAAVSPRGQQSLSDEELGRRLDEFITYVQPFGFSGGVSIMRRGKIVLEKGYGLADRAKDVRFTAETAFDIGSNTKDFTKLAILQLAEKGKLRLDDPISKFFPTTPKDKADITISQVVDHTAGFPLYSGRDDEVITREAFLKRLFTSKLLSLPGKEKNYSNPGYSLLAAIIETISGQSWEQTVSESIFKPAGMTETGYALPKWNPDQIARSYADGKDRGSTFDFPHAPDGPYWNLRGNGGTLSTLRDMAKFYAALEGNTLLSKESKALLFPQNQPVVLVGGNGVHYFVYHRDPEKGVVVIIASTEASMRAMDMDRAIAPIIEGLEYTLPPQVIKPSPGVTAKYAGTYALPSGARVIVEARRDGLLVAADGQEAMSLLSGGEPVVTEEAAAHNARAQAIAEASARGDYDPLFEAFGKRMPLDQIKRQEETILRHNIEKLGALKSIRTLGTFQGPKPGGLKTTMGAPEASTTVRFEFESGATFTRYMWGPEGLAGMGVYFTQPSQSFLPQSVTEFFGYDLALQLTASISFEIEAGKRATGLAFVVNGQRVTLKRVGS